MWGYDSFRPAQRSVIETVLGGKDVLAVLPTGGGKSLLYQVPALLGEGLVLVLSPLIALMQDQVAGLARRGIPAVAINSTLGRRAVEQALIDARYGKYKLVYLAPERLTTDLFQSLGPNLPVKLLAVDEAHCVSEWAPHFRPAYRTIAEARTLLGDPPVMAVTATATPEVRKDIISLLNLRDPVAIVQGFDRPNLTFSVLREDNKRARLLDILRRISGTGIVYATTRREVEEWAGWLQQQEVSVSFYHGGMEADLRRDALNRWMQDETRVMVATNAFGMGIDKPDVRFVVHVSVPASIEAYYQEAGRGGRDGESAHAVLLWQPRDLDTQRTLLERSHPTPSQLAVLFDAVGNLGQVPVGSRPDEPVTVRLDRIEALTGFASGLVHTSLGVLERAGVLTVEPTIGDGTFRWLTSRSAIRSVAEQAGALSRFIEGLMRLLPAQAFHEPVGVSLHELTSALALPADRLARGLAYLSERGLAAWHPSSDVISVLFRVPRSNRLSVQDAWLDTARAASERRLQYMERFLTSPTCRRRYLLGYFGESAPDHCGRCDVCRRQARATGPTPADTPLLRALFDAIHTTGTLPESPDPEARLPVLVNWLVQEEYAVAAEVLSQTYHLTKEGKRYRERLMSSAG